MRAVPRHHKDRHVAVEQLVDERVSILSEQLEINDRGIYLGMIGEALGTAERPARPDYVRTGCNKADFQILGQKVLVFDYKDTSAGEGLNGVAGHQ